MAIIIANSSFPSFIDFSFRWKFRYRSTNSWKNCINREHTAIFFKWPFRRKITKFILRVDSEIFHKIQEFSQKNNLVFFLKMTIFTQKIQNLKFLGISLRIILAYRCEATWTIWLNIVIDMTKTERFIFDWKCVICLNIFLRNGSQVMWVSL